MYTRLLASSVRAARTARPISLSPKVFNGSLNVSGNVKAASSIVKQQLRFYADKKSDEYKSILNDDLLEKAGLDTDAAKEKEGASSSTDRKISDEELYGEPSRRKNATKSSADKKKEFFFRLSTYGIFATGLAGFAYLCRDWDQVEEADMYNEAENGFSPGKIWTRFNKRMGFVTGFFNEPAFDVLLPDAQPAPYHPPLTLVLELDDLLVHSEWSQKNGWRTAKRMGVDYFLGYLSQYYEIVVFSKSSMAFSENIISKLDPYRAFITYSLFKEACRTIDGKSVKDLSLMNRDLGKLIIIDPVADCYSLQPENAIPIDKWEGGKEDGLIKLIPFLEYVAVSRVKDVRPVLASFKDKKNIPAEFAEREKKLRQKFEEEQAHQSTNVFGSLLGNSQAKKKMPLDAIREAGQKNYLILLNYLKENGDKFLEEEKQRNKELYADQKLTLSKIVTDGMPTSEDIAKQQAAAAAPAAAAK